MITGRRVFAIVAVILAVNLAILIADAAIDTDPVRGPAASSYVTTGEGVAAWYELLDRTGHPTSRLRTSLTGADLDPATTLVMLEPFPDLIDAEQLLAVARFVRSGGRLIAGGALPEWLREVAGKELTWSPSAIGTTRPAATAPETGYVGSVVVNSIGAWSGLPDEATPLMAGDDGDVSAAALDLGLGRMILLADTTALMNTSLDSADNAAFAIGISGEAGRPVVFVEHIHGYTDEAGLSGLPDAWLWAIGLGVIAVGVYLFAIGRRLGPSEEPQRPLPPARREYLDALAGSLVRTGQTEVAATRIRLAARDLLGRRTGLSSAATDADLAEAGKSLELDDAEIASILGTSRDPDALLAAGRALARLTRSERTRP